MLSVNADGDQELKGSTSRREPHAHSEDRTETGTRQTDSPRIGVGLEGACMHWLCARIAVYPDTFGSRYSVHCMVLLWLGLQDACIFGFEEFSDA